MSDWRPMHHEEIPPEPKPKPEPRESAEPRAGQGVSLGLSLNVPPDMMDRMKEIAEGQAEIIRRMDQSSDALTDAVASLIQVHADFTEVAAGIAQGQQEIVALITAEAANAADRAAEDRQRADEAKAMMEAHKAHGDALMAALQATGTAIADLSKAILAPRKVTLTRDESGLAVEAVSKVET